MFGSVLLRGAERHEDRLVVEKVAQCRHLRMRKPPTHYIQTTLRRYTSVAIGRGGNHGGQSRLVTPSRCEDTPRHLAVVISASFNKHTHTHTPV